MNVGVVGLPFGRLVTMAFRAAAELRKMGALSHDDDSSPSSKPASECRNDARTSKGDGEEKNLPASK